MEPTKTMMEAAAKVMNEEGFDIKLPWVCDLDDVERYRRSGHGKEGESYNGHRHHCEQDHPLDVRSIHTFIVPALRNQSRDIPQTQKSRLTIGGYAATCGNSATFCVLQLLGSYERPVAFRPSLTRGLVFPNLY